MSDEELEATLRATLAARAATVTAGPTWNEDTDTSDNDADRARRLPGTHWLRLCAAAAVILAVAGGAIGVRQLGNHTQHGPTNQPSTRTSTSSPPSPAHTTVTPSRVMEAGGLHAATCKVTLPSIWKHAVNTGRVALRGYSLRPLAISSTGTVVAAATGGTMDKLVLIGPDGRVSTLFASRFPSSWGDVEFGWAAFSGKWVAFTLRLNSGQGAPGATQIDLVNTANLHVRVVRPTKAGDSAIINSVVLLRGRLYWNEHRATMSRIRQYDIGSTQTHTIARGALSWPKEDGGGLYWSDGRRLVTHIRGRLPPGFPVNPTKAWNQIVSDKGVDAWFGYPNSGSHPGLWLWRAGMSTPLAVTKPSTLPNDGPLALAMPYLTWWSGDGVTVLDTRTGAYTTIGKPQRPPGLGQGAPSVLAADNDLVLDMPHGDGSSSLSIIHTKQVPGLTC